jgi:hypothetical protein
LLLLGGAAVLGISAGVAIAYGLRANSAPAPRVSATQPVPAVVAPATAVPSPAPTDKAAAGEPTPDPGSALPGQLTTTGEPSAVRPDGRAAADVAPLSGVATAAPARPGAADAGEVKVAAKQLKVRGGLSAKEVASTLESGLTEIESCYDAALAQKSTLRGTLKLSWSIDRAGNPTRLKKLGGTLKDPTVERCSLDTIRNLQFPVSKKRPTNVVAPLAFQSRTGS